jgi:UrcA family protein
MNDPEKAFNGCYSDSAYGKLALMAVCSLVLMVAIGKQLPASAAEKSAVVSLADLDLSTEKGMQAARERVHDAARQLCSKVVNPWSLSHHPDYVQCVDDATANAVTQLQGRQLVANANAPGRGTP